MPGSVAQFAFLLHQKILPFAQYVLGRYTKTALDKEAQRGLPRRTQIQQRAAAKALQVPQKLFESIGDAVRFARFQRPCRCACSGRGPGRRPRRSWTDPFCPHGARHFAGRAHAGSRPDSQLAQEAHQFATDPELAAAAEAFVAGGWAARGSATRMGLPVSISTLPRSTAPSSIVKRSVCRSPATFPVLHN